MSDAAHQLAVRILGKSWEKASELERRVLQAVAGRLHVSRPLHQEMEERLTPGERLADRIATFGGSWPFISSFLVALTAWMVLNSMFLAGRAFDPYPYILLNLVLSCVAALQAPVILMSQNRLATRDRLQAAHDYEVNLKAELEIMQLHEKVEGLRAREITRILDILESQQRLIEALRDGRRG